MLDMKFIRENPEAVKKGAALKGMRVDVDRLLALDGEKRALQQKLQELQTEQNKASKELGPLMGQFKKEQDPAKKADLEKRIEAGRVALGLEIIAVNRAQQKGADLFGAAELQKLPGVRQFNDRTLRLAKFRVKPRLQLIHRHIGRVAVVKFCERQGELRPELFQRHRRSARLREDEVGRLQDRRQIVHERSRPVENDIANHEDDLTTKHTKHTKTF